MEYHWVVSDHGDDDVPDRLAADEGFEDRPGRREEAGDEGDGGR